MILLSNRRDEESGREQRERPDLKALDGGEQDPLWMKGATNPVPAMKRKWKATNLLAWRPGSNSMKRNDMMAIARPPNACAFWNHTTPPIAKPLYTQTRARAPSTAAVGATIISMVGLIPQMGALFDGLLTPSPYEYLRIKRVSHASCQRTSASQLAG